MNTHGTFLINLNMFCICGINNIKPVLFLTIFYPTYSKLQWKLHHIISCIFAPWSIWNWIWGTWI